MLKSYKFILPFILATVVLNACEDSIELDLGAPVEQLVIDAVIDQTTDTQFVYITRSMSFLENGNYKGYKADSVGIVDAADSAFHLFTYMGEGKYYFVPPSANTFKIGNTYQFIVRDGVNTYVSQSKLNAPTIIDSFTYAYKERGAFGTGKGNYVTLWAKDKPGKGDYYWFKLYRNDSLQAKASDLRIAIDNAFNEDTDGDGDLFIVPIRENFNDRPYLSGETAKIDIFTIPQELYYYLNLINTQLNNQGLFAVPPSNIPGNIICMNNRDIKILGFFAMTGKVSTPKLLIP